MWTFEPSAALAILEGWERRYKLDIRRGEWLDRESGVKKEGGRIVSIKTLSGNVYRGKVFVDATYEGDLMAAAGISYTVGREANSVYGETINGIQRTLTRNHQLAAGVDPLDYELLFRNLEASSPGSAHGGIPWINSSMPNRKTDTNNRTGFSTDFIGGNWNYPEASYAERKKILAAHLNYQQGLMWTLANHPRVPEHIRKEVSRWGTCRDKFSRDCPHDDMHGEAVAVDYVRTYLVQYVRT